ncbi:hypothetical protein CFOL_v3_13710, partial [Cephalotus follicularis]
RNKTQSIVTRSTAKAKYMAMAPRACELLWLGLLLKDLGLIHERSIRLYYDNKAAISIAHNLVQHDTTNHIVVDKNFIKEKFDKKLICTPYVKSNDQQTNVFNKGLSYKTFHPIVCTFNMRDIHAPT